MDATAAIGIMSRRSRVDVNELLLQSVEDKKASVARLAGGATLESSTTKPLAADDANWLIEILHCRFT